MTHWTHRKYTIGLLCWSFACLLGLAYPGAVGAAGVPLLEPLWSAPEGPAKMALASAWVDQLQRDIQSTANRCPQTVMPSIAADRAAQVFRLRRTAVGATPVIVYLQDPVLSTFVVIASDVRGCLSVYQGGRLYPSSQRHYLSPFPNTLLPAMDGLTEVQVLIQDGRVMRPWLRVLPEADFQRENLVVWMFLSAICAVLLVVIVSMYAFARRNRTVAAYVVYVAVFLWWVVQEFGMNAAWFPGLFSPAYFVEIQCITVAIVTLSTGWAVLEFLALKGAARRTIWVGLMAGSLAFFSAVWWPSGYRLGSLFLVLNAGALMAFLVRHLRGSDLPAKLFATGFASTMVGGGLQSLSVVIDAGEFSKFAVYAYACGGFIQVLLWLVAITTRLKQERNQLARWRREELEQKVAQATVELVKKTQLAEDATRAKSDFLAAASHDLRQPTHALGMLVARLGQCSLDASMRDLHRSLDASARAIQDLLGELMDYSLLDASGQKTDLQAIRLDTLLADLGETLAPLAADKGLVLKIRPSTRVVSSDLGMLRRMVLNVALNAIRYTDTGTVFIAARSADAGRKVRIEVWDSGIGIAANEHAHIFKEFYQVANAARNRNNGIGLGLSIVQRSAQLLGHTIVLRSTLGCGSRFSIIVPTAVTPAPTPVAVGSELNEILNLSGILVVLVEDDELSRKALADLLGSWGCGVLAFSSGAQALAALAAPSQQRVPDILLSDFRLGGNRNGIEVIRDVRLAVGREIPGCLISGDMSSALMLLVKDHNVTLLHKPVQLAKLRSLLRRVKALQGASHAA